jgi:hypothetical protein
LMVLGAIIQSMEAGIATFMLHSTLMFHEKAQGRILPATLATTIVGVQLIFTTFGYGLIPWLVFALGFMMVGWWVQRASGLSLAKRGEPAYQRPMSVGMLVLLPAVLVLLGFIPAVLWHLFNLWPNASFQSTLVSFAASMLACTLGPLMLLYLTAITCGANQAFRVGVIGSGLLFLGLGVVLSLSNSAFLMLLVAIAVVILYMAGIAIGYSVFHAQGFRLVWAKRLIELEQQASASFDSME